MSRLGKLKENVAALSHHSGLLHLWRNTVVPADRALKRAGRLRRTHRGCLILMFHRVSARPDPFRPGIDIELFNWLCQHLRRHYQVVSLEQLEASLRGDELPSRAVALTFDDGYADNYYLALPMLERYGLPATVFATTGAISGEAPLWFDRVALTFEQTKRQDTLETATMRLPLDSTDGRARAYHRFVEELKLLNSEERERQIAQLSEQLGTPDLSSLERAMVTWDQLREMDRAGFTAGAHTVTHPILSRVSSEQARHEIEQSKRQLEEQLDRPVETFAYPNGQPSDYNADVVAALKRTGLRMACTTRFAANTTDTNRYALNRVSLYAITPARTAAQLERFFYLT